MVFLPTRTQKILSQLIKINRKNRQKAKNQRVDLMHKIHIVLIAQSLY